MSIIKQDRQKLLLDLYNQGKNTREIAKEARMSFRDIGSILNKADERREQNNNIENKKQQQEQEQLQQLSLSTQAYKLFSERKTPIEVAVALNVREAEVTRFYKEYLKLDQMHDLNMAYEELKGDITPFLKLYRSARAAGMSEEHVVHLLRIANDDDDLPAVERKYEKLKQEVNALEIRKLNLNNNLQDLKNQISTLRKTLGFCNLTYKQQSEKIAGLHAKRIALEDLVRRFENNNEEYLKINQTIKDKVSSILSDGKGLLGLALYSLMESIRNEPVKYSSLICYNGIYGLQQQQYTSSQNYYVEHYTTMLIEEAERLYNKLVKEITKGITYEPAFSSSSSSSSPPVLSSSSDVRTTTKSSSPPKSAAQ
jgi:chromosome segregation ATPase